MTVLPNSILLTFKEDESRFTAFFRMVQLTRSGLNGTNEDLFPIFPMQVVELGAPNNRN